MSRNKTGICPVCGAENLCALSRASSDVEKVELISGCWCTKAPGELDRGLLPEALQQVQSCCLCRTCLEKYSGLHPQADIK